MHRLVLDQWSPLSHKELIGNPKGMTGSQTVHFWGPSWVPASERRRLNAYMVRAAYMDNVARHLLPPDTPEARVRARREYGDVSAFVDRVVASILGEDWALSVDGADEDLTAGPRLPEKPGPAAEGADPLAARVAALLAEAYKRDATAVVDEWAKALASQPAARARQTALRNWADLVGLSARIHECEHDAVGLADGVYVLWPRAGDWPTVEVYDPGVYFPQLDLVERGEFPPAVFFAWDFEKHLPDGTTATWVRRLSFELTTITAERSTTTGRGLAAWIGLDGEPLPEGSAPPLVDGEVLGPDGLIRRTLPWHGPDDQPTEVTCVFSDGEWPLDAVTAGKPWALSDDHAVWHQYRTDMRCDFVPVIHNPNTPSGKEHFGRGIFDHEAQLLDDISQTDTRIMGGSRFLGEPMLGIEGASLPEPTLEQGRPGTEPRVVEPPGTRIAPGRVVAGKITAVDLTGGITELRAINGDLRDRFLQNVGAPAELFGRVTGSTSQSTSAAHLALKYAPWAQVVAGLRLPRAPKYELLLRQAQRLAQLEQRADGTPVVEPGPTPRARLLFGNFLPMNQSDVVTMVADALKAHAISRQTGVALLVAAGIPIDDAQAELERIVAEDTGAALEVAEALAGAIGETDVVAARLGVTGQVQAPGPPVMPKVTLSGHEAT